MSNLIFYLQQISGLGILIAGIVVLNDVDDFSHFLDGRITAPPIILIVTGLLIFLIAFLGCYGALKESPKLLMAVSSSKPDEISNRLLNNFFTVRSTFGNYFYRWNCCWNRGNHLQKWPSWHTQHSIAQVNASSK